MKIRIIMATSNGIKCCWFEYDLSDDITFRFSTLNECRDDVRDTLIEWAAVMGLRFKTVEVNAHPWLITVIESDERED